jgi:long-subunit acyl-CoA synthetase (AMP-forming)
MKKLIEIIINIFVEYVNLIAVRESNVSYTYKEIYTRAKGLANTLNSMYKEPITIALVANNSVNWIVVFFGVLLSKHRLVIFPSTFGIIKTSHVVINSGSILLFTSLDIGGLELYLSGFCRAIKINNLKWNHHGNDIEHHENKDDHIITYSPRQLNPCIITESSVLQKMRLLDRYDIFKEGDTYIAYSDFSSNYILGLLLPFIHGSTIVISKDEDSWAMSNTIQENNSEVVILNSRQFENLYNEIIEDSISILNDLILTFKLGWLRKIILKKRVKKYFPNLRLLVILNSTINPKIETTLKSIKVPYIVTYGRTHEHNIETFSRPESFVQGSIGEILDPSSINNILEDDSLVQIIVDDKVVYRFLYANKNMIQTEQGFIISENIELALKNISPVIRDCIVIYVGEQLTLIMVPDMRYANFYGYDLNYIREYIWEEIQKINKCVHTFERIDNLIILPGDFSYDTYGRVMKDYYNDLRENLHL